MQAGDPSMPDDLPLEPLPYAGADALAEAGSRSVSNIPLAVPTAPPTGAYEGDPPVASRSLEAGAETLLGSPTHRLIGPATSSGQSTRGTSSGSRRRRPAPPREADPEVGNRVLPDAWEPPPAPTVVYVTPTKEEEQTIRESVTKDDLERLRKAITDLYAEVEKQLAGSRDRAAEALGWLNEARTITMARPQHFPLAELRVAQTRVLLQQVAYSEAGAAQHQSRLVVWSLLWLLLLGGLYVLDGAVASTLVNSRLLAAPPGVPDTALPTLVWGFPPILCLLVGGIGGVMAALITLGREVSRREYDPASNTDYYASPVTGALLGVLVYYIFLGGLITAVATTEITTNASDLGHQIQAGRSPLFIVAALLAGFAQARMLALLPQVWSNVTGTDSSQSTPAPTPKVEDVPVAMEPTPAEPTPPPANSGAVVPADDGSGGGPIVDESIPVADQLPDEEYDPLASSRRT